MEFTTVNHKDLSAIAPEDRIPDRQAGLSILMELVQLAKRPRDWRSEVSAVTALEDLERRVNLSEKEQNSVHQLEACVAGLEESNLHALLDGIGRPRKWQLIPAVMRPSAYARHRFLLVLTLQVIATTSRYNALNALHDRRVLPTEETYGAHLQWINAPCIWGKRRKLCQRYLELASRVWYGSLPRPSAGQIEEYLATHYFRFNWRQQLVVLLALRHAWIYGPASQSLVADNPAVCAETPEFTLAHTNSFSRLRLRGGRLACSVLEKLQYINLRRSSIRRSFRSIALVICACALLAISLIHTTSRIRARHLMNEGLVERAKSTATLALQNLVPLHARKVANNRE